MGNRQAGPKHKGGNKLQAAELIVLAVILLIGLFLRGSYLLEIVKNPDFTAPEIDAAFHDYWARGLADGDWSPSENMSDPEIRSTPYFRPPGYPYFLTLVYLLSGSSFLAARIVQMWLGLANCVLAYILGRSLFGRTVGLILAGFMSIYWVFIYFEGELLAPVFVVFCALVLINLLQLWTERFTYMRSIIAGLVFGILVIVRPNVLLFVPLVLAWAWWLARRRNDGRRFRTAVVGFLLSGAAVVAPVTLRNCLVANDFVLISSNAGVNLYIGNNEQADGVSPIIPGLIELAGLDEWTCFSYPQIVRGIERTLARPMKHSEVSSYFMKKAGRYIYGNPLRALKLVVKKALYFWGPAEVSNNKEIFCAKQQSATLRYIPGFPIVVSSAIVGLMWFIIGLKARLLRKELPAPQTQKQFEVCVLIVLFIGSYFVSYLPFFISARFRVPIIPFLLLFGAYAVHQTGLYIAARDFRRLVVWLVVWVGLYVLIGRPFVPYKPNWARWYYNRGIAYERNKQINLSIQEYNKAIEADPSDPWARNYFAGALLKQGRLAEAAEHYQQAILIKPDLLQTRLNLGVALYKQGKINEAISHWTEALRLKPDWPEAHNNLAGALYMQGKTDEAAKHWDEALRLKSE